MLRIAGQRFGDQLDRIQDIKTLIIVQLYQESTQSMKRDGWLKESSGVWILRFRYDWSSWDQNSKVIVDKGRLEHNGIPLLKSRKRIRRNLAIQLWKNLLANGWRRIKPQWEQPHEKRLIPLYINKTYPPLWGTFSPRLIRYQGSQIFLNF